MKEKLFCGNCMDFQECEVKTEEEHYSCVAGKIVDITITTNISYCLTCGEQVWNQEVDDDTLLRLYKQAAEL